MKYILPQKPMARPSIFNRKLIIALATILGFLLIVSAILEMRGAERELTHVLDEQSLAIMTALEKGSSNAIQSFDLIEELLAEKLLSNARLIEQMDYANVLSEDLLKKIAKENHIFRANIFDERGDRVFANSPGSGIGRGQTQQMPQHLLMTMKEQGNDELVLGFGQRRYGAGQRFAVAKRRRKGGAIVLNIDAAEMLEFRKTVGAGKLIREIGASEGVLYVVLEDTAKVLLASSNVDSISAIKFDSFLQKALQSNKSLVRRTPYKDTEAFEVVKPLLINNQFAGLLRIGLSMEHLREAKRSARTRAILVSLVLLIVGVVVANWVIGGQNYRALQSAYDKIETYTGSILANMNDAVVALNPDGKILVFNKAAEKMFHVKSSETLGKECSQIFSSVCPLLKNALESGQSAFDPAMKIHAGGKDLIVSTNITALKNELGNVDMIFAVIRDITEQRKLQENLQRKDQITAMGHLASGVAHEIRNPLNAISMIAQRFQHEFEPKNDADEYQNLARTIVSESYRINNIVQQFLQFSRPARLIKKETDISKIVADVATLIRPQAIEKGIIVESECSPVQKIHVDADKLEQAILNIAKNSLDACSSGDKITLTCMLENKVIKIIASDNGPGIPQDVRDKIFNMYFTTKQKGTGIGLSIVQQIISLHDGTIEVTSHEGKGTTFIIQLPILE